jgi:hypothetical protein
MGKWQNGRYVDLAIEPIIQRENGVSVWVKTGGGRAKKIPLSEFLIEKTFIEAIKGDVKAHEQVVKWAKQYLLPGRKKSFPHTKRREIAQADVDLWKAAGALPSNCSPVLEEINLANLNKAYRTYRRSHNNEWPEQSIRALRKSFNEFLAASKSHAN